MLFPLGHFGLMTIFKLISKPSFEMRCKFTMNVKKAPISRTSQSQPLVKIIATHLRSQSRCRTLDSYKSEIFERDEVYRKIFHPTKLLTVDLRTLVLIWQIGRATPKAVKDLGDRFKKWEWLKNAQLLIMYPLVQILLQDDHYYEKDIWEYSKNTRLRDELRALVYDALTRKVRMLFSTKGDLTEFTSNSKVKELKDLLSKQLKINPTSIWQLGPPKKGM